MNNLVTINADSPLVIENRKSVGELLEAIECLVVEDNDSYEMMDSMLSTVHERGKKLDSVASGIIDPINTALKAARALFKPISDNIEIAKSTAKRKMGAYKDRLRAEKEAEDRRIAREAEEARAAAAKQLEDAQEKFMDGNSSIEELEKAEMNVATASVVIPQSNVAIAPKGTAAGGTQWVIELPTAKDDVAALLEFIAADLRKDAPRFGNTVSFKVTELKSFVASTNGQVPVPGLKFNNESKIIAR